MATETSAATAAKQDVFDKDPRPVRIHKGTDKLAVKVREELAVPTVYFAPETLEDIQLIIGLVGMEVGALFEARRDENGDIHTGRVVMTEQRVRASQVILDFNSDEAWEQMSELRKTDLDLHNNLRGWFHSHVNFGVSPSGQDDSQMESLGDPEGLGYKWFVRVIANKSGDMRVDVFDYVAGLEFHHVPWEVESKEDEERLERWAAVLAGNLSDERKPKAQPAASSGSWSSNGKKEGSWK